MIQITGRSIRIEMEVLEQWFWIWEEENSFFDISLSKVLADWCKIGLGPYFILKGLVLKSRLNGKQTSFPQFIVKFYCLPQK